MPDLIWITGAAGLIGRSLQETAPAGVRPRGLTRTEVELTDFGAVDRLFAAESPRAILHCAALSKSPECQRDPARAHRVNVEVTRHLAGLGLDIPFLFFSSDLVFDGKKGDYAESDPPNPLLVYGETKALAEQAVLRNPRHMVIRTSLNGGITLAGNRSFTEEMRLAWESGRTLRLFQDEFRCPIPVEFTARAVWELLDHGVPGLYHVAGARKLSRWQIGQALANHWKHLNCRMESSSLRDYPGGPRPADTSLNCGKVQSLLSFRLPAFDAWLLGHPAAVL